MILADRDPAEYFQEVQRKHPGALESHWIPTNSSLWKIESYSQFLEARRRLLAESANRFLQSLLEGALPEPERIPSILDREVSLVPGGIEGDDEEKRLRECNALMIQRGLAEGELLYEVADRESGEALAVLDLAWPEGLQPGLTLPVAILIDESADTIEIAAAAGFRCFTEIETFLEYVRQEILGASEEEDISDRDGTRRTPRFTPARFNDACADRVQQQLGLPLIKHGKVRWKTADGSVALLCAVSRAFPMTDGERYWHIYKPRHGRFLEAAREAYVALGCGSVETILLIPFAELVTWLDGLNTTVAESGPYWHLHVHKVGGHLTLVRKQGYEPVVLDRYLLL